MRFMQLVTGHTVKRLLLLFTVSLLCSLVVANYDQAPSEVLQFNDVAPRTVRASTTFHYNDYAAREAEQQAARETIAPVYVYEENLKEQISVRIASSFAAARQEMGSNSVLLEEDTTGLVERFRSQLGVYIPASDVMILAEEGFPEHAEELATVLFEEAMGRHVVADREALPPQRRPMRVISLSGGVRTERTIADYESVVNPQEAREQLTLRLIEMNRPDEPWVAAASVIARASIRPNFSYDAIETENRREHAVAAVPMTTKTVKRGTTLFRKGDVLTELHLVRYRSLRESRDGRSFWVGLISVLCFVALLFLTLYQFGTSYLRDFSDRFRDLLAIASLTLLMAIAARIVVASADGISGLVGNEAAPESVWFLVPVAGAAMLVRLLVGVPWTLAFAIVSASVCGLLMNLQMPYVVFFIISSVVAAGAVEHTRERMAVVKAGVFTGLLNAATVLLIHFVQLALSDGEVSMATTMRPVWSMMFAFSGGILSAFLVLGLIPVFESLGFVTDYRMMELANLNHPLMRQLMLKAPGTYHHSVVVGSLAEAACDAVGANALESKVCAYFHDIGKMAKPFYFVENQRDHINRHDQLDPYTSAQIIINHVIDGLQMAHDHGLPKPIIDNIAMHHGTGLLPYFHHRALQKAGDAGGVDESLFRYPGPKPNTREAGILMLADKVEAATRTIKEPNERKFTEMIGRIINSVMGDGQFENCPLTFQEIYTIADSFSAVLVGIHHHRIEYPPEGGPMEQEELGKKADVISLDLPDREAIASNSSRTNIVELGDLGERDDNTDYESLKYLPGPKD